MWKSKSHAAIVRGFFKLTKKQIDKKNKLVILSFVKQNANH